MTLFVQTFRYASEPFFFSQAGKEDARMIYARVMDWFVLGCAFIFAAVMLFMDVFQLFIGDKFRVGLPVVPILLLANLFLGVYLNISIWYKLTGKTGWGAWFSVFGAVVTVLLNFILIPTLGYLGAAWATLICYALMMVVSYLVGQRFYKVPYDTSWFLLTVTVAVVVWGAGNYLSEIGFPVGVEYAINFALLALFPVMAWLLMKRKSRKFAQ